MKRLVFALAVTATMLPAAGITKDEKGVLIKHLQRTSKQVQAAVKGLSAEQFQFKSAPDRWSVAECLEHIAASEDMLRQLVTEKVLKTPAKTDGAAGRKANDGKILAMVVDRSQKAQAPEPLKPTNRFTSPQASLAHFLEARKETIRYSKTTDADLRAHTVPHPVFKELDAYQWLLLLSAHSERHTKQILEVKADPNFPKK